MAEATVRHPKMNSSSQPSCTAPETQPQSSMALPKSSHAPQTVERVLSWGRYPRTEHRQVYKPAWNDQLPEILKAAAPGSSLPFGLGRSYGDSCLNAGRDLIQCHRLNRILDFDEATGVVRCESGVALRDIIDVFLPKGWFLPVTPGTSFVSVGGAIANDVHGKNHHCAGTFGAHVHQIALHRSDKGLIFCSSQENAEMLRATIGGLGLTGIIAWADIQLKRIAGPWIDAESIPFRSLKTFLDLSHDSNELFEYTVAWIDCFAGRNLRGIFFRGNHAAKIQKQFRPKSGPMVPFELPTWILNRYSVQAFNSAFFAVHLARKGRVIEGYDSFFYPLDAIRQWNLLYGSQGFLQYQCVIPETKLEAFEELLDLVAGSGMGSFLVVLKQFGSAPPAGMLSFPRPGLTKTF